jgi:hypothetical protein
MENKIQELKDMIDAEAKLTPEEVEFGHYYPVRELIAYTQDELDNGKKAHLEKLFKENIVLKTKYLQVRHLVENEGVSNEVDYNKWVEKLIAPKCE